MQRFFKRGAQNPRISQTASRGFPNNEAASAKERRLKLPEWSVHPLSALHPGICSSIICPTSWDLFFHYLPYVLGFWVRFHLKEETGCVCVWREREERGEEGRGDKGRGKKVIQLKHLKEHWVHSLSLSWNEVIHKKYSGWKRLSMSVCIGLDAGKELNQKTNSLEITKNCLAHPMLRVGIIPKRSKLGDSKPRVREAGRCSSLVFSSC